MSAAIQIRTAIYLPSKADFVFADEMTLEQAREAIGVLAEENSRLHETEKNRMATMDIELKWVVERVTEARRRGIL